MRIDIAIGVNLGDTIYDCFWTPMIVVDKTIFLSDRGQAHAIKFIVKDAQNNIHEYDCNDLYLQDLEDESD